MLILQQGEMIDEYKVELINTAGINSIKVRSVLTCELQEGVCAKCYGRDLSTGKLVAIGTAVGIVAAQSIGEPGTQLTMRTFHIGGAATRGVEASSFEAIVDGRVKIINPNFVVNSNNKSVIMSRSCEVILVDNVGQEITRYKAQYGSILLVADGQEVTKGTALVVWDPYAMPIVTEKSGYVMFKDMIDGVSVKDIIDESTGIVNRVIIEPKQGRGEVILRPRICLLDQNKQPLTLSNGLEAEYFLPVNSILSVEEGANVSAGDILARIPREFAGTKDITGGLPRVIELFEARKPKNHAVIAEIDGCVKFGKDYKSKRRLILQPNDESHEPIEYILPKGRHVTVNEGDVVKKGDMLIEGSPVLQDILKVMGVEALGLYIINEIQAVYRLQGVKIDNKHIEVIITRMLQKVEITDSGDSNFVIEEKVNKREVINTNKKLKAKGLREAQYRPVLQGITKASLQTQSFISAASFQETTRVLTEAAIAGKVDKLEGLKENVIVGQTIPAGTGFYINEIKKIARQRDKEIIAARDAELQENNTEA
ncbi:RNA polymerase Rpb1, domain 5 family protein [Orientia tsutsugamushi str. Sido]|nr:RNA polymerase Rpb1, domain 5 family protein [Orientia tsutsugamushi str. Sido]